jgi:DNA polymerase-3 subunit alpha (Gram-positive type)
MMGKFESFGIETFNDLNLKLQNEYLKSAQFPEYQFCYCKKQAGIKDIYRLVSNSCTTNLYRSPRVLADELYNHRENLIIANSPAEGDL